MNQKPASMPIFSLSMSASSGARQSLNDGSHSVSAEASRDAVSETVAVSIPTSTARTYEDADDVIAVFLEPERCQLRIRSAHADRRAFATCRRRASER